MARYLTATLFAGILLAIASADAGEQAGLQKLEGSWGIITMESAGKEAPKEMLKEARFTIKGNDYTFRGGDQTYRGKLTTDASKKPAWITATFVGDKGEEKGRAVGVYELQGDRLKILWHEKGDARPKDFADKSGESARYLVLQRAK